MFQRSSMMPIKLKQDTAIDTAMYVQNSLDITGNIHKRQTRCHRCATFRLRTVNRTRHASQDISGSDTGCEFPDASLPAAVPNIGHFPH